MVFFSLQISNKKYPKLIEIDDVLGGSSACENVDSTDGRCISNNKINSTAANVKVDDWNISLSLLVLLFSMVMQ
jgi:hypothetical protein